MNEEAISVSAALALAKGALETVVVRIVGEVCELNDKPGYKAVYFSVKDEQSVLPCQMWLSRYNSNNARLKVGDMIDMTGRFSLYAAKGRMSFDVFGFSLAGEGNLRLRVAALARKLETEGLMNPASKKPVPAFPQRIGLVTSPRGAAVHDVFRTLRRRFPLAEVEFAGVPVEGADAPDRIMEGIRCVARSGVEVILVVRGGGSYEDLMPYNDERLARCIAACPIPVVTGIGHEPDTTIADMVADLRASTPTAAAEAVSPSPDELKGLLEGRRGALGAALVRRLDSARHQVALRAAKPVFADPSLMYASQSLYLDSALNRLERLRATGLQVPAGQVALRASRLQDLSPLNIISRGYSLVRNESGRLVTSVSEVNPGDSLRISVSDGSLHAVVTNVSPDRS